MSGTREGGERPDPLPVAEQFAALDALLTGAPFGFALLSRDLRFVHVNAALAAMNGRDVDEHLGRSVTEVGGPLDATVGALFRQVTETGEALTNVEVSGTPTDGDRARHWIATCYPVQAHNGTTAGIVAAILDVTDRHEASARLAEQARRQTAVVRLGLAALRGGSLGALMRESLEIAAEVLAVDRAAIFRATGAGDRLVLRATHPDDPDRVGQVMVGPGDGSQAGHTMRVGEATIMRDARTETRFSVVAGAGDEKVRSSITVLVPGTDQPYGVLGGYSLSPRDFDDDDVRFVQSLANVLGTAVERRRAEQDLELTNRRLRLAQEAGRMGVFELDIVTNAVTWSEALEHLYGLPTGGFGGTYADFRRMVHPEDVVRVEQQVSVALEHGAYEIEHRIVRADGAVRWIVARGELVDAGGEQKLIGINVDITARKATEQERVELLAAEQNARAEAEQARERLAFLAEASAVLGASLEYRETLEQLAGLAVRAFADACVVDLLDPYGRLEPVAIAHAEPEKADIIRDVRREYPPESLPLQITRPVVGEADVVVLDAVDDEMLRAMAVDERHLELLRGFQIYSGMLLPLTARGTVIGMVSLLREEPGPTFDADDRAFATELTRRAAVAVDNAQLFDAVRRTGERHRRMAETLQATLLPPQLPTVPGVDVAAVYRPAAQGTTVGGDFYDLFPLGDDAWGFVVGDVQGKGTEAATLTGLVRHTIRTAAIERDPGETLEILNRVLVPDATDDPGGGRFCTVIHGRLRRGRDGVVVDLASGGHPPALVRRADGTVEAVGGMGMLIGVFPDLTVHRERATLRGGDALLLYTDGVLDARGADGDFGEARLAATLRGCECADADAIAAAVSGAVLDFTNGEIRDDLAVLALRVDS